MDIISFNEAATANGRIQNFNANPDSVSGIVTVPKVIQSGESVTIPAGRVAILPNVQVAGELTIEGEVFIPNGSTFGELDAQISSKAPLASPALTGTPTINGVNVSGYSGFKNYIINGKKTINQRGFTSTDNSYNQDRWYKAGNNWYQGIEGDNNLVNGKTYTLSWSGSATAGYYVGTATSSTINAQTFTSITNGGSFTLTITAGQNLWIKFASDATGSTFNSVQLEEGTIVTPFENRHYGLEMSLCQVYFQLFSYGFSGAVSTGQTYFANAKIFPMRNNPSVTWAGPWGVNNFSPGVSPTFVVVTNYWIVAYKPASGSGTGQFIEYAFASAEL